MPPAIVTQLNTELRKIIDSADMKAKLARRRASRRSQARPRSLDDFVKVQLGKWGKMIKDAGIQPE